MLQELLCGVAFRINVKRELPQLEVTTSCGGWLPSNTCVSQDKPFYILFDYLVSLDLLPIALYRKSKNTKQRYIVSNPKPDTILKNSDDLIVIESLHCNPKARKHNVVPANAQPMTEQQKNDKNSEKFAKVLKETTTAENWIDQNKH